MIRHIVCLLATLAVFATHAAASDTPATLPYWVLFTNHGPAAADGDEVYNPYIDAVREIAPVRTVTRWFNGVSVDAEEADLPQLDALPFVAELFPVGQSMADTTQVAARPAIDYGQATAQVTQLNADSLHALGFTGNGVVIAFLDAGFNYLNHPAFSELNVLAQWDFVDGDADVAYGASTDHGTEAMSCAVAYAPGDLVGTAYGASVVLARTEDEAIERPIEEDNMILGIEWAVDQQHVDVISASIGYNWFEAAWASYDHDIEELDGNTTLLTKAADKAAGKGTVVVVAAGNEHSYTYTGTSTWVQGKILFPGDGDSVICVGGVTSTGAWWSTASEGPTYDGRIKPDVSALASGAKVVALSTGYTNVNGTSFATPLIAGVAALLVEAHPDWDPLNVMTALHLSASKATSPDTLVGWGVPDAYKAYRADHAVYGKAVDSVGGDPQWGMQVRLYTDAEELVGTVATENNGWFLFDDLPAGTYHLRGYWNSTESLYDEVVTIPSPPRQIEAVLKSPNGIEDDPSKPGRFWVGNPFPNPANPSISIAYTLREMAPGERIEVAIVNTMGQVVHSSIYTPSATGSIEWNGVDNTGASVASGVYFARLTYDGITQARRLVLLR